MRFKIMRQDGYASVGLSSAGGTLTGSLILSGNPLQTMEATNKSYVDGVLSNINAANLTTGTLAVGRMPAFTGDISNPQGTANFTLKASGVSPGSYPKVTVDTKGLVTNGYTLTAADMPPVSWNKITTGKPTTLAGYGITDAVPPGGGTVVGVLSVTSSPTDPLHVVNKSYVDSLSAPTVPNVTGDIIRRFDPVTPAGYLRCNGGLVSKTAYPALYAIFGDNAVSQYSGTPGAGKPWRQQYEFNTTQTADITGWTTGTSLPGVLSSSQVIVTQSRVYLLGGDSSGGSVVSTVYTAPVNADGTLGTWTTGPSLPGPLNISQAIVTKNRVYLLGGHNGSAYVATVYTAPINADGTLGTWTTGTALPGALGASQAIVTKNRVYLLGGFDNSTYLSTVYTAPINADGTLGAWSTGPSLPDILSYSQAIVTKNRVYLLGGMKATLEVVSTVYTAPINADGTLGAWATGTSLPGALGWSQAVVTKNRAYLLRGANNSNQLSTVYTAPINADGTLGTWTTGTSLPGASAASQAVVTKNRVYLLGGGINTAAIVSTVYTAPFSGGLNDYSTFYTTGYSATDPDNFQLPDYTGRELDGSYTYIKI